MATTLPPNTPHLPCIPTLDSNPDLLVYIFQQGLHMDQVRSTDNWEEGLQVCKLSNDLVPKLKTHINFFLKEVQHFISAMDGAHLGLNQLV